MMSWKKESLKAEAGEIPGLSLPIASQICYVTLKNQLATQSLPLRVREANTK